MTTMLMIRRAQLVVLCQKYRVRRLDVFGSAAQDDFDEQSSDIDLLVEFDDMPYADRADAYLGLLTEAEALLGRHVDLVEVGAVRNPYPRWYRGIAAIAVCRVIRGHRLAARRRNTIEHDQAGFCSQFVPKKT